jgi:2-hydroxychromene-2-carboxylate isomerase
MPTKKFTATPTQTSSAAATMQKNAAAATAAGGSGTEKCDFCDRVGLPILPLRYAVVPTFVPGAVSDPLQRGNLGADLKGKPAAGWQGHRYALRTLRKGYVMVYLGSGQWNAYVVSEGGHLRKLADVDDPDFKNDREMSAQCKSQGHNIPASFINIPALPAGSVRKLPTKVWVAFSDVLWTKAVRKQYEGGGAAPGDRKARMQAYSTASLGNVADTLPDAFQLPATEAATSKVLNDMVLEYAASAEQAKLRSEYDAVDPYDPKKRNHVQWRSAHGVHMRTGENIAMGKHATRLTKSNREELMASAVVLYDPVGIVQELNATRLDFIKGRQNFMSHESIARPLLISQAVVGLKAFIGEQMAATVKDEEAKQGLPDTQTHVVSHGGGGIPGAYVRPQTYTYTDTRAERSANKANKLWDSLQEHYRESDHAAFEKNVMSTLKSFTLWLNRTDADYASLCGQADWVLRRGDYDIDNPEQQDLLIEAFAPALGGGPCNDPLNADPNAPAEGIKTYEMWVKYLGMDPADKANPLYVALFGDQKEFLDYLLPDGVNPAEDKLDKGSKLYKVIKTVIGTKEITSDTWTQFKREGFKGVLADDVMVGGEMKPARSPLSKVDNPVRLGGANAMNAVRKSWVPKAAGAAAHTLLALGGALSRLGADAVSAVYRATALRAVQGAIMLYEKREIFLVTTRIKVREYLAYLNDIAFKSSATALGMASRTVKQVAQRGAQTVRSMAVSGALRISDPKVRDAFIDVMAFAYDDLNGISNAMGEIPGQLDAAGAAHDAAQAMKASENAAMAAAMRVHPFSLSPQTQAFVSAASSKARAMRLGSADLITSFTRSSLRFSGTGSGILAVGSLVMQLWSLKDNAHKAQKAFVGNNEARVLVTAAAVATIGAAVELAGVAGKLAAAKWATRVSRLGSAIGGAASIVEGIQAAMAGVRTGSHGDNDARDLYYIASGFLIVGGGLGIYGGLTGAALLGPIGWALILIAAGIAFLYFAAQAEDTQAGIWLDRCYWGKGSRYANAKNPADRPWTNREVNDELAQLNAIVLGMNGETGFNDDYWGLEKYDTVKAKVTFPFFDPNTGAYEWRLVARGSKGNRSITLAKGSWGQMPEDPEAIVVRAAARKQNVDNTRYFKNLRISPPMLGGPDNKGHVIEVSVEVWTPTFSDVELTAEYVPDVTDAAGRASLVLSASD